MQTPGENRVLTIALIKDQDQSVYLPIRSSHGSNWKEDHPDTLLAIEAQKIIFRKHQVEVLKKLLGVTNNFHTPGYTDLGDSLDPHADVIGLEVEGIKKTYPLSILRREQEISDTIGKTEIILQ